MERQPINHHMRALSQVVNLILNYNKENDIPDHPYCQLIKFPRYPDFATLENRVKSFSDWSNDNVNPLELARAGFFYIGDKDIVSCYFCHLFICDWEKGDNPLLDHVKASPSCPFLYLKFGRGLESKIKLNTLTEALKPSSLDRYTCKVCLEKEIGCLFWPCHHTVTCTDCAPSLTKCPMCRELISNFYRLQLNG